MRSFVGSESSINRANGRARVSFRCFPRNAHKRESFMRKVDQLPHSFKGIAVGSNISTTLPLRTCSNSCMFLSRPWQGSRRFAPERTNFPWPPFRACRLLARLCRPRFALFGKNPQHQTPSLFSHILDAISAHTKDCIMKGMADQQRKKVSLQLTLESRHKRRWRRDFFLLQ